LVDSDLYLGTDEKGLSGVPEDILKYKAELIFCGLIIAALAVGTYERNKVWTTDTGVWLNSIKHSPNKDRPYNNVGAILMHKEKLQEAKPYIEKAVSLKGEAGSVSQMEAINNLGIIYGEEERFDEAFSYFESALKLGTTAPKWKALLPQAENNYGLYKFKAGEYDESLSHIRRALRLEPRFELARLNFQRIMAARIKKNSTNGTPRRAGTNGKKRLPAGRQE
jgi:tetratricopeptide (TPR) repeat protein